MTEQDWLDEALDATTQDSARLKQRWEAVERLRKLLEGLVAAQGERPALALALLEKDKAAVSEVGGDDLQRRLRELWADCAERTQAAARESTRTMPEHLSQLGVAIDTSSRHPKYTVEQRLVEIDLDTRKYMAIIRPRHGQAIKEPLDPPAVARRVQEECARLLERPFDHRAFLKQLTAAHSTLAKTSKKGEGRITAMVRDLAAQMAKPGKPKLDEFAVDLGRLLTSGGGESVHASHTRDTDRGLLLYGLEQGGYVGSIDIRRSS